MFRRLQVVIVMSDFDKSEVDWSKVRRKLAQANNALQAAEDEMSQGFVDVEGNDLTQLAYTADDIPHDVDELIKGVTNSSSHLRNGTMNYIPR